jgi:urea transport system permease protein
MIAGVALGGRSSLFGPVLGAIAVGYGRSTLSEQYPARWIYFQGALFIVVVLLLPNGVASLGSVFKSLRAKVVSLWPTKAPSVDLAPSEPNEALA